MKRFTLVNDDCAECGMEETKAGDWVRHEDAIKLEDIVKEAVTAFSIYLPILPARIKRLAAEAERALRETER